MEENSAMAAINTNLTSLASQQNLKKSQSSLATSMERLSSGLRVNSAKDDAAGQAIGNRLQAQRTGLGQAARNANDGVSLSQTAHGVLDRINDKLQRIRELTVQGLSDSLTLREKDIIQAEINSNLKEVDRLADSANYNGIPLLNGRAGDVGLQVGASDGEKVAIDLTPPGFSVDALGLDEFTIAGIDGEVTPRDGLQGYAHDIHLDDTATTILFPGVAGANRDLKEMSTGDGNYGYYVSATSGGQPVFYDVDYYTATHNTATDTSEVNVNAKYQIYTQPSTISSSSVSQGNIQITDDSGNGFSDSATRALVQDGSSYLIQETDGSGVTRYYEAEMRFTSEKSGSNLNQLEARQVGAALPSLSPEPDAITSGNVGGAVPDGKVLGDADELKFVDSSDNSLSDGKLVEIDGDYYLHAAGPGGESLYYALEEITQTQTVVGTPPDTDVYTTFTLKADTSQGSTNPVRDDSVIQVDESPEFAFSAASVELQDDAGNALAGATRLMERNDPGHEGEYVIEIDEGGGVYSYYTAELSVTTDANGQPSALAAKVTGSNAQATFRTDETDTHNVLTVSGYSQVTIDPRNVEVNYTDSNGEVHNDVLRAGSEGDNNYYFDLPNSSSEYGSFKIASLVDTEDNDILIKTINGNGEVIIYHPSNLNSGYNISVITDANGFDNGDDVSDGIPRTIINIVESAEEIRLKKPKNPLAALDRAIGYVDSKRSHLGAIENRLGSLIEGNQLTAKNLASAQSRIMDADYAVEVANMTRAQILQQAGSSMLAQANVIPESVLTLLN